MKNPLIIFDFDGVIADSFNYCLAINQMIYPEITPEQYKMKFWSNFYEADAKIMDEKTRQVVYKDYWKRYLENLDEITLFAEMDQIISLFNEKYKLVISSSAIKTVLDRILIREKIDHYFDRIYGSDVHESKVEKFKMILADYDIGPDDCVFVTDTLGDLCESEKAGISSIAVSWGFHDAEVLQKGTYRALVHKPSELIEEVDSFFCPY